MTAPTTEYLRNAFNNVAAQCRDLRTLTAEQSNEIVKLRVDLAYQAGQIEVLLEAVAEIRNGK